MLPFLACGAPVSLTSHSALEHHPASPVPCGGTGASRQLASVVPVPSLRSLCFSINFSLPRFYSVSGPSWDRDSRKHRKTKRKAEIGGPVVPCLVSHPRVVCVGAPPLSFPGFSGRQGVSTDAQPTVLLHSGRVSSRNFCGDSGGTAVHLAVDPAFPFLSWDVYLYYFSLAAYFWEVLLTDDQWDPREGLSLTAVMRRSV